MSGLVMLTSPAHGTSVPAGSDREEELQKEGQGASILLTTKNGAQSPDDRCYNRLSGRHVLVAK